MFKRSCDSAGVQVIATESGDPLAAQSLAPDSLWLVNREIVRDEVRQLVSHLDYWLLTGKLFREEHQKPATEPDIANAEV